MSILRYGIQFPDGVNDASIERHCYRWGGGDSKRGWRPIPDGSEPWEHLYKAIKADFPEVMPDGRRGYVEHHWTIPRVKAWCDIGREEHGDCDVWWGPSSVGKTVDAAVLAIEHWLSAPDKTTIHVVSTSVDMLKVRIFGDIARFYQMLGEGVPGEYKASKPCIVLGDENSRNVILGHAVHKGNAETSINNLIGIHNDFNVLIIDEFQGTLKAATDAATNLKSSGIEFKMLGMGNPQSRLDPMGRHSEPEQGWDSINETMEAWKTKYGMVHFFDGRKSPGVKDPKKYFFLLNQKRIDETKRIDGENSVQYYSQRVGWMPPEGIIPVVMSESFIVKFKMQEKATWKFEKRIAAGFDPAYSASGDRAVLCPFEYGFFSDDTWGIEFLKPIRIELGAAGDKLMAYHIADQVKASCRALGISPDSFAMDCTGMQGALADVIEKEWGPGILRVQFGGKASDLRVDEENMQKGSERYKNRVTELWYTMNAFGRHGQIRGLSDQAVLEFTQRRMVQTGTPVLIESKSDMKARTGASPDEADAAVVGLEWVRQKLFKLPGGEAGDVRRPEDIEATLRELDVDADENLYLSSAL